ncbi:rod shape-determining protein MreC [Echinicola strongylocentroti]|uniref:Cell shape-determining protein MreC n=1 Tax=Echinicola strongylocentroti TaxID=1795355 RepID=A0A2Z4IIZ1_9BACT|nr:rod shape-determining protein MreC [Echinicola strongylocentroti]AWW30660.1 rod shape-determining protein MreC [Echinicola strongylocentroti]
MQRILLFLYSIRAFLLFITLETAAVWLIVSYNSPQGAVFFNSSNTFTGAFLSTKDNFTEYFTLGRSNEELAKKNAQLMKQLANFQPAKDSVHLSLDSAMESMYEFRSAKVINNSINLRYNYITLNRGAEDGIKEGMGVFNGDGIVGRVKGVSSHYASVISLLHTDLFVSSKIKSTNVFGSTQWDGKNPQKAKLKYVPRHVQVAHGDTVVTSGYNAIFPEGILVGTVDTVANGTETNYLDITIELAANFSTLTYVYLVENNREVELDSLQEMTEIVNE